MLIQSKMGIEERGFGPVLFIMDGDDLVDVLHKLMERLDHLESGDAIVVPIAIQGTRYCCKHFEDIHHPLFPLLLAVCEVEFLSPFLASNIVPKIFDAPFAAVPCFVIRDGIMESRELDVANMIRETVCIGHHPLIVFDESRPFQEQLIVFREAVADII